MYKELDVNAYCHLLSKSDVLSARLVGWTGRWSLFGGFMLCCQCLNTQTVSEAKQPFKHLTDCTAGEFGENPWTELGALVADVQAQKMVGPFPV